MPTILIVEDEAYMLRVTSLWLQRCGYEVRETQNGAEAMEVLDREQVDVILSDMHMPVMNGLEVVRNVRTERRLDIPFLLLTASCDQDRLAAELKPYDVHLYAKPFVPSRLVEAIDRLLRAREPLEPSA